MLMLGDWLIDHPQIVYLCLLALAGLCVGGAYVLFPQHVYAAGVCVTMIVVLIREVISTWRDGRGT